MSKFANKDMSWAEFKEFVDSEMERQGISQDALISWIDITSPNRNYRLYTPDVRSGGDNNVIID